MRSKFLLRGFTQGLGIECNASTSISRSEIGHGRVFLIKIYVDQFYCCKAFTVLVCNPAPLYSEANPIDFCGTCSQFMWAQDCSPSVIVPSHGPLKVLCLPYKCHRGVADFLCMQLMSFWETFNLLQFSKAFPMHWYQLCCVPQRISYLEYSKCFLPRKHIRGISFHRAEMSCNAHKCA